MCVYVCVFLLCVYVSVCLWVGVSRQCVWVYVFLIAIQESKSHSFFSEVARGISIKFFHMDLFSESVTPFGSTK